MTGFVDDVMVQLADPLQLTELVAPATDPTHERLKQLFAEAYTLPFATLHDVDPVAVDLVEFQRPLFPPTRVTGTWMQKIPSHTQTDFSYEGVDAFVPTW